MSNIDKINKLLNKLCEDDFLDIVKSKIGSTVSDVGKGLVTGLARASGIPIISGASDTLGDLTSDTVDIFLQKNKYLADKVKSNTYFYKDTYRNYQSGNYGYDTDIPKDKFLSSDLNNIKTNIYPSFKRFGYICKFIDKRSDTQEYLFILFKDNSKIPIRDGKLNPIIYPFPFDLFHNIENREDSDVVIYDLLKLYNLPIERI